MVKPLFEIRDLFHAYRGKTALSVDHLIIPQGKITALIGPNGAGKSTFLRLLSFIEQPVRGKILYQGKALRLFEPATRKVVLLPQEPYLLRRSVFENVAYGLRIRGQKKGLRQRVYEALALVGLAPEEFAQRPWYALSGGEAQRVALASRLVLRPEVLLLDEPTSGVDAQSAFLIQKAVLEAQRLWGTNLIIATHDWDWVSEIADTWFYFAQQQVWEDIPLFVPGPWQKGPSFWVRPFRDGASLELQAPRQDSPGLAVFSSKEIKIYLQRPDKSLNILDFQIFKVSLNKKAGKIFVFLSREDISLVVESGAHLSLYPGQKVWLSFPQRAQKWL